MSNENNVADRIALQDVMLKYAAGVDERDFDLYASCFLENVEVVDSEAQLMEEMSGLNM